MVSIMIYLCTVDDKKSCKLCATFPISSDGINVKLQVL